MNIQIWVLLFRAVLANEVFNPLTASLPDHAGLPCHLQSLVGLECHPTLAV